MFYVLKNSHERYAKFGEGGILIDERGNFKSTPVDYMEVIFWMNGDLATMSITPVSVG